MVASATENYGVDMRTMRDAATTTATTTILQKALSSASRSSEPASGPQQSSFQVYRRTTFRSGSPPLPDLGPSRTEEPRDGRSPPSLLPELRQPVPKIFSPQPPAEKQLPLDLIVTTSATLTIETAPVTCEAPAKKKGPDGPASSSRRNPGAEAAEPEDSPRKPDAQLAQYESRFTASVTQTTRRKAEASPGRPPRDRPLAAAKEGPPFARPGPSSSRNRRVASSPKRRPGHSAWSADPDDAAATLDLRTESARSKDHPSAAGSPPQTTVPVVPALRRSGSPPGTHPPRSHHPEASPHKGGIERIYGRNGEEEQQQLRRLESGGGGPANGLVKITLSVPADGGAGVKCLGCGVSDAKFLCSGCRKHWYCSAHCQTMRWPEHSRDCGRFYE